MSTQRHSSGHYRFHKTFRTSKKCLVHNWFWSVTLPTGRPKVNKEPHCWIPECSTSLTQPPPMWPLQFRAIMCCPKTHPFWHYYPATLLLQCCREVAFQPPVGVTVQSSMRNAHGRTNATCGRLVSHQSAATDTQTSYYGHSLPRGSPFIAPRQPFTIQPLQESFHARSPRSFAQEFKAAHNQRFPFRSHTLYS